MDADEGQDMSRVSGETFVGYLYGGACEDPSLGARSQGSHCVPKGGRQAVQQKGGQGWNSLSVFYGNS